MRFSISLTSYAIFSYVAVAALVTYAVATESTLFGIISYICYQKVSLLLFGNAAVSSAVFLSILLIRTTMGRLRDLEMESIIEAGKTMLVDTILFLVLASPTIDGAEVPHGLMFLCIGSLLGAKVLHFIASGRTTHLMEAGSGNGMQDTQIKLAGLFGALLLMDSFFILVYKQSASLRSNFYMWMLFEFSGLFVSAVTNSFKLAVLFVDASLDNYVHPVSNTAASRTYHGWPFKNEYILFVEVIRDLTELALFLGFFVLFFLSSPARLPIYLANDLFQVGRASVMRVRAFLRYKKLAASLDIDFPDATLRELFDADNCIICRDLLTIGSKRLPCSHVLHLDCIRSWFVHHQTCPTCRAEVPLPSSNPGAINQSSSSAENPDSRDQSGAPTPNLKPRYTFNNPPSFAGESEVRGSTRTILRRNLDSTSNSPQEEDSNDSDIQFIQQNIVLNAMKRFLEEDQRLEASLSRTFSVNQQEITSPKN